MNVVNKKTRIPKLMMSDDMCVGIQLNHASCVGCRSRRVIGTIGGKARRITEDVCHRVYPDEDRAWGSCNGYRMNLVDDDQFTERMLLEETRTSSRGRLL